MDTIRLCRHCGAALSAEAPNAACAECGSRPGAESFPEVVDGPLPAPTPAELAPLLPGLEIMEVAGHGGMATIYKARQPQLDRVVALKVLSPELGRDPAFAQRFSREAQALAKLNHSNIVRVFDFGQAGDYFYLIMEYVDGVTLRTLIEQKAIHAEEPQRIVIEICHALQYAHEEGIVHRDIKPSNILVDKKGRVKIADFGLAQLIGQEAKDSSSGSSPTMVMGTPQYMAPEQVERPWKVDRRADIYALGVMLYEMLTGELPAGETNAPSLTPGVNSRLDEIVLRALARQPRRRYQNANDLRAAVESATQHFQNLPGDMPRNARSRKWRWLPRFALAAGTIWLLVVTFILLKERWSEPKSLRIPAGALEALTADSEGVGLGRRMVKELNLSKEQAQIVNKILWRYKREFSALERRHTELSKNAAGHDVKTIQPFPREMDELMGRMWATLATVLSGGQLASAKDLHFERFFPHTGMKPVVVEIWQEDNGEYHYVEGAGPAGKSGAKPGPLAPHLSGLLMRDGGKTND